MININQQALLELLKASLFDTEPSFPEGVDWDAVLQEAKDQTVVALAAPHVPSQESGKWQVPVAQNTAIFLNLLNEQTKLIQLCQAADIPLVILKGFAAAMYYPAPLRRSMGDVDFLVPPEYFEQARALMEENEYEFHSDHGTDRDYSYTKRGVVLELHHRYSDEKWDIDPLILKSFPAIGTRELFHHQFPVLPEMVNGLILLDHVRHHLQGGLGIRQIIDWMMFVHAHLSDENWKSSFSELARQAGLETLAVTMTSMCKQYFGLPDLITWCDSADEATTRELLEAVLNYGNFGSKLTEEIQPSEYITISARRMGLFRFLQTRGEENWKNSQNHPFLRHFAWMYQIYRYITRGTAALFRGENIAKGMSSGTEKYDLLERLGLNR
ncbi:nucleotidyltransferase domain-containing protein [Ruminococcus difficilis]|uniref:Nucleotidyltransferase family protein n=1 Tax=Ruminococcus difficilis TaxID=2763069 RepID=A0A934U383_9FIRM|nr:nucleotidyltransferase family protein [Ruminococcus difficilis]MBK6087579.1 nucleotidyltransferase family protein [Ruminococcus difficilis]